MKRLLFATATGLVLAAGFFGLARAFSAPQVPIKNIPVPVSSASVSLALSNTSPRVALAMGISGIVPGVPVEREITVTNTGSVALAGIYLHISTSGGSPSSSECYSVEAVNQSGSWTSSVGSGVVG